MTAIDLYPHLLGIAIDEDAAIVISEDQFRVVGQGRVVVYDNQLQGSEWFYDLEPDAIFDLGTRTVQKANNY